MKREREREMKREREREMKRGLQKRKQDFEEGPLKFSCGLDATHCNAFRFALMFVLNICDGSN